jgi:hypothetical protein
MKLVLHAPPEHPIAPEAAHELDVQRTLDHQEIEVTRRSERMVNALLGTLVPGNPMGGAFGRRYVPGQGRAGADPGWFGSGLRFIHPPGWVLSFGELLD